MAAGRAWGIRAPLSYGLVFFENFCVEYHIAAGKTENFKNLTENPVKIKSSPKKYKIAIFLIFRFIILNNKEKIAVLTYTNKRYK